MSSFSAKKGSNTKLLHGFILFIFISTGFQSIAQRSPGFVGGRVTDGTTNRALYDVAISSDTFFVTSASDGNYAIKVKPEGQITYRLAGFQTKTITGLSFPAGEKIWLDIVLFPLAVTVQGNLSDSLPANDSLVIVPLSIESGKKIYNAAKNSAGTSNQLFNGVIQPGTDRSGVQVIKRLNGIVVQDNNKNNNALQSLTIMGLGDRYNQLFLNGAPFHSLDPVSRAYPLAMFPSEIIASAELITRGKASMPADFSGGIVNIKTKDMPEQDFFYVLAGGSFSEQTINKRFLGDKRKNTEFFGLAGSVRNLPGDFPTGRSQSSLDQKNLQEQIFYARKLNNNLAPVDHGSSVPGDRISIGYGKTIRLKKGEKIGIIAFINQQQKEIIQQSETQVMPDVAGNPYPFSSSRVLIRSHSSDTSYRQESSVSATANASIEFGRNKISFRNFFSSQSLNNYTRRYNVYKRDEDTAAHAGIYYLSEQRMYLNSQLSGQHALGENSRLKIDWQATYSYYKQRNPDERSFLLRENPAGNNTFEIARPSSASLSSVDAMFTNTNRSWREYKDHNFTGAFNLQFPFNLFHHAQVLSGGVFLQTRYRELFSDILLTKGTGFFPLNELIAAERYFPGGLNIQNYFVKFIVNGGVMNPDAVNAAHRANYTASANLGASYIQFENRFTKKLSLNWGFRAESISQLISTSQYNYFVGYKNAQLGSLDENDRVTEISLLPSAELKFDVIDDISIRASFFKTVNRPQLQELARFRNYDPTTFIVKTGNPLLENAETFNYEAGAVWLPNARSIVTVTGFYKEIDRPIEYILTNYGNAVGNLYSTPNNMPLGIVRGISGSFRISLDKLAPVTVFGNATWSKSKVSAGPVKSFTTPDMPTHQLSGSPEYTINGGVVLQYPKLPMLTVLYQRYDDYISALGSGRTYTLENGNPISAIPDYRVKGMDQLDIQISQKLFKSRFQVIGGVSGLLQDRYIEYQDLNGNGKFDSPLVLRYQGNAGGFAESGIDNTVVNIKLQRSYYLTLSYLFK